MEMITLSNEVDAATLTATLNAMIAEAGVRHVLTHCAICAAALTDAVSAQIGIGPICRKRCDYDKVPAHLQAKARETVRTICLNLTDKNLVMVLADELHMLGLERLSACLVERFATVTFWMLADGRVAVKSNYQRNFAAGMRSVGAQWGRIVERRIGRAWLVVLTWESAFALREVLAASYAGCVGKIVGGESFWIHGGVQ